MHPKWAMVIWPNPGKGHGSGSVDVLPGIRSGVSDQTIRIPTTTTEEEKSTYTFLSTRFTTSKRINSVTGYALRKPIMDYTFNTTLAAPATGSYHELYEIASLNPKLSFLEKLWWTHYAYWDNDIIATGIITFLAHEILYFSRCIPWIIADAFPSLFHRFKIQDTKAPPSAREQWNCVKYILAIHFIVELPLIVLFHPMMEFFGLQYTLPFPDLKTLALQTTIFFFVEDTYHYWLHRAFHWGPLYRAVHRVHHQYATPFGLTAEYASPWETMLLGFGTIGPPLVLGWCTGEVHLMTVLVWVALRQFQAIDAHSGYDFPWSLRRVFPLWGGSDWHDDHHRYFRGNYSSSFKHWDVLMGTVAGPRGKKMKKSE
ncbi:sterol desaturase family protein [Aspergillus aculeatinus CBS 121060]|nr:C-4 methylsterol oxidase [Aspergillus aculeatinus CBS 121060]RAH68381.1 C-4 methylsterol oxidase [Aspergillus aculeatinus CBS 121060]